MTINEIQDKIIDDFSVYSDWMDKYEYLIEIGKHLNPIEETSKTDNNLIKGCQSKVWIDAKIVDNKIIFEADSDAIITKGMISLLIKVLSNQTPDDILSSNLYFIDEIGLKEHLSPTRSNGLVSMIKKMKIYALAYKAKENL